MEMRTASEPRYSDDRQNKLERYARGKCSAARRIESLMPSM